MSQELCSRAAMHQHGSAHVGSSTIMSTLASQEGQVTSSLLHTHQFPPVKVPWMVLLCAWGASISLTPRGTRLSPPSTSLPREGSLPIPVSSLGAKEGAGTHAAPARAASPFPP